MSDAPVPPSAPGGPSLPATLTVPQRGGVTTPRYAPAPPAGGFGGVGIRPPGAMPQPVSRQPIWDPVNSRWITPPPPAPMTFKFWTGPGSTPAPRAAVSLVLVAAVVAAISLVLTLPGLGWLLSGLALTAVAIAAAVTRKPEPIAAVGAAGIDRAAGDQPGGAQAATAAPAAGATAPGTAPIAVTADVAPAGAVDSGAEPVVAASARIIGDTVADDVVTDDVVADEIGSDSPAELAVSSAEPSDAGKTTPETSAADTTADTATEEATRSADAITMDAPDGDAGGSDRWRFSLREHGERVFWTAAALALLSVGTFRAAGWLFAWCVLFALASGALALSGGRTVKALFLSVWTLPASVFRSPAWLARGFVAMRSKNGGPRVVMAIAISVLLLVIFGGLFAGADAEFAHLLGKLLPPLKASELARGIFCFIVIALLACGVGFLAAARPTFDEMPPSKPRRVSRLEWVLPLAVLNAIFAIFVFVQLTVLFGHDRNLLGAASKAAMKGYAHKGFWELLVVSILTLTILMITGRIAPSETRTDRTLLRVLLGGLTVFSIVIVLAALKRVGAYESAYGYTRLRVVVAGVELWLGLLFVLILVAGITLRASWLPRVIVASLVLSLFAGALANPDRYVAQRNVERYHATGKLSVYYLTRLSADAVPVIETLPPDLRDCALASVAPALKDRADDWRTWNFARSAARADIGVYIEPTGTCPDLVR